MDEQERVCIGGTVYRGLKDEQKRVCIERTFLAGSGAFQGTLAFMLYVHSCTSMAK